MSIPTLPGTLAAIADVVSLEHLAQLATSHARALLRADGCTLVLREGDLCHYLEEEAIEPLWKGRRFAGAGCISGWVMRNRTYVVIQDIRGDMRIPQDVYLSTFVRSLAMVPIDREEPVGACGAYWASRHAASQDELADLHAIADAAAVALRRIRR